MRVDVDSNFDKLITDAETVYEALKSYENEYNSNLEIVDTQIKNASTSLDNWNDKVSEKVQEKLKDTSDRVSKIIVDLTSGSFLDVKFLTNDLIILLKNCKNYKENIKYFKGREAEFRELAKQVAQKNVEFGEPNNPYTTNESQIADGFHKDAVESERQLNENVRRCNELLANLESINYLKDSDGNYTGETMKNGYAAERNLINMIGLEGLEKLEAGKIAVLIINGEKIYISKSKSEYKAGGDKFIVENRTTCEQIPFKEWYDSFCELHVPSFDIDYLDHAGRMVKIIGKAQKVETEGEGLGIGPVGNH